MNCVRKKKIISWSMIFRTCCLYPNNNELQEHYRQMHIYFSVLIFFLLNFIFFSVCFVSFSECMYLIAGGTCFFFFLLHTKRDIQYIYTILTRYCVVLFFFCLLSLYFSIVKWNEKKKTLTHFEATKSKHCHSVFPVKVFPN